MQALLFGQAKRASRILARLVSLAQKGELARRLPCLIPKNITTRRFSQAKSSRLLYGSLPADVLWGSFITHSFLNEFQ